jgi:ACR3 family arsenite transporter
MRARGPTPAWILLGVVVGGLLGLYLPTSNSVVITIQWLLLGVMVFLVVSSLPLLSMGRAIAKPRALVALLALNLLVVPLVAFVLSRVVFQVPSLQVGLLLVLLAPGVALSLITASEAGGDVESVLGAKPLIFVGQLVLVPLYTVFLSWGVLRFEDVPSTFLVVATVIGAPTIVALLVQWGMTRSSRSATPRAFLANARVPVIAVVVTLVVWNKVPSQLANLEELFRVVPLFFSFLVLLAPLGLLAGILASLSVPEKRAIMILGAGRGGVIMLPISLALDQEVWGLVPLVVITQLAIELVGMMVYRTIVPEIVPSDSP